MSDAADPLAQALRDIIKEAVQQAVARASGLAGTPHIRGRAPGDPVDEEIRRLRAVLPQVDCPLSTHCGPLIRARTRPLGAARHCWAIRRPPSPWTATGTYSQMIWAGLRTLSTPLLKLLRTLCGRHRH